MKLALRLTLTVGMTLAFVWAQKGGGGTSGGTTGGSTGGATGGSAGGTTGGTTGGTPGGTTGGPTGTGTGTSPSSPSGSRTMSPLPTAPTQPVAPPPKPIFLSGNVVADDGSPLPPNVNIQSVCGSQQHMVAHTSSTGDFSFLWGNTAGMFEDASENGPGPGSSFNAGGFGSGASSASGIRTIDPLMDCDLRADVSGYTSSKVSLANHPPDAETFDVGAIVLHRITGDEGRVVSMLALKAPKEAKKNFDKGTQQVHANKLSDAAASFQKSVKSYPQYADAWLSLGRVESKLGAKDAARADFLKAMELDNKLVGPWQELGYMASDEGKWADAAHYLDQAVRLDPMDSPMAWYFNAMVNFNLGRYEQAERSARTELKLDKNPRAQYLLGLVLIARKDLKGGADALRAYLATSPKPEEAATAQRQLARVEGALGK